MKRVLFDANIYGEIVIDPDIDIIKEKMKQMAQSYYKAYREFGGSKSVENIIEDFTIIACASVHGIDIVVSDDEKSMLTENAIRAYKLVNSIIKKRTPDFIDYEEFKRRLFCG